MNSRQALSALLAAPACLLLFSAAAVTPPAHADDKKMSDSAPASLPAVPRLRYRIVVDQGKWNEIRTEQWNIPP